MMIRRLYIISPNVLSGSTSLPFLIIPLLLLILLSFASNTRLSVAPLVLKDQFYLLSINLLLKHCFEKCLGILFIKLVFYLFLLSFLVPGLPLLLLTLFTFSMTFTSL